LDLSTHAGLIGFLIYSINIKNFLLWQKKATVPNTENTKLIKAFLQATKSFSAFKGTINFNITITPSLSATQDIQPEKDTSANDILGIPAERDYKAVRLYITERCRFDNEFKEYVDTHSRVNLCQRLTDEFGWDVDSDNLGRNINRHNARQRKK
jgi:hypothetical protein